MIWHLSARYLFVWTFSYFEVSSLPLLWVDNLDLGCGTWGIWYSLRAIEALNQKKAQEKVFYSQTVMCFVSC